MTRLVREGDAPDLRVVGPETSRGSAGFRVVLISGLVVAVERGGVGVPGVGVFGSGSRKRD